MTKDEKEKNTDENLSKELERVQAEKEILSELHNLSNEANWRYRILTEIRLLTIEVQGARIALEQLAVPTPSEEESKE